jgi:hypothetical protein
VAFFLPAGLVIDQVPERDVVSTVDQVEIASPEGITDRKGEREFPDQPI